MAYVTKIFLILPVILIPIAKSFPQCENVEGEKSILCRHLDQTNIHNNLSQACARELYSYTHYINVYVKNSTIHILPVNTFDFKYSGYIRKLALEGISIQRIIPGTFSRTKLLEELSVRYNSLKKIGHGIFTMPQLRILDLQHNELQEIDEHAFTELVEIRKVLLNHNNLSHISNIFDSMSLLEYLDLSHNTLKSLDDTIFYNALNLTKIFLNNNNLSTLSDQVFSKNNNLTIIDLAYNPMKHINFNTFKELKLESMNISFTEKDEIIYFDKILFNVSKIYLNGNSIAKFGGVCNKTAITSLSLGENDLTCINNTMFQGCFDLDYLNLSKNRIDYIDKAAFSELVSLETLDLSANKIQILPHGLFSNMLSLEILDLADNLIQVLPYGLFDSLENLLLLDISFNEISSFVPYSLHSLRNLRELHLDNNNIEFLDGVELTTQLVSLKKISLDHNLWSCSRLVKLVHILENKAVKVLHGNTSYSHNVNKIKCEDVISLDDYKDSNNPLINYVEIAKQINDAFSSFTTKFYSSDFYSFFNKDFKSTKFYEFFNNIKSKDFQVFSNTLTNVTEDKSVAYKLLATKDREENSYTKLEVVLYLLCIIYLLNLVFGLYKYFNKTHFITNRNNANGSQFESNTELV